MFLDDLDDQVKELSPRMSQTLRHLLAGASEKEIALSLGLSPHTVHDYVKGIHKRFGVRSRGELLAAFLSASEGDLGDARCQTLVISRRQGGDDGT